MREYTNASSNAPRPRPIGEELPPPVQYPLELVARKNRAIHITTNHGDEIRLEPVTMSRMCDKPLFTHYMDGTPIYDRHHGTNVEMFMIEEERIGENMPLTLRAGSTTVEYNVRSLRLRSPHPARAHSNF